MVHVFFLAPFLYNFYNESMIYLLLGNKNERKIAVQEICKQQNIETNQVQNLYEHSFKEVSFENLIPVFTGLFNQRECYVIHGAVRDLGIKSLLKDYSRTEHIVIFSEETLLKKDRTLFEKNNVEIREFEKEQKAEVKKYNTFALADVLGQRDKKNLWLGFRDAIKLVSAEEIHGILFWQLKNLLLVKTSSENPGLNPFVYRKNQSYAGNFSEDEIRNLMQQMTKIFHKRETYSTLEIELEKIILVI